MSYTIKFEDLSDTSLTGAGGKGESLAELAEVGFNVPSGFIVTSDAFQHFLNETGLASEIDAAMHKLNADDIASLEAASEQIREIILTEKIPEDITSVVSEEYKSLGSDYVAVRSSATEEDGAEHAWAGQLESYLNVGEEGLFESVKKCWASLFLPRALLYRLKKGFHGKEIGVGVVVQEMIGSEKAGVAFSAHPVTQDRDQLVIEAVFGLGESLVSGKVSPDTYVIEKEDWSLVEEHINDQGKGVFLSDSGENVWRDLDEGGKKKLGEGELKELAEVTVEIESHHGFPVDVEWAIEGGELFILQCRPITTLSSD